MSDHSCQAAVIHCIDYRLTEPIHDFLVSLGLTGQYDDISIAGAAKGLVETAPSADTIREQIEISHRLHHVKDVYIIHHTDCGAYGGHAAFESLAAEKEKQCADMQSARDMLQKSFPDIRIYQVLARIKDDGQVDFEMIT